MSEYSKLTFTDGTLLTAGMMNQLSDNIEYALETPPSGLNVNGKTPDNTKTIKLTATDVNALYLGDGDAGTGDAPPLNANTLGGKTLTQIFDTLYPVGCIYQSTVSTSPAELFGVGTWEQLKDRFLLAAGDTYTAGDMGGEAEHILTREELPTITGEVAFQSNGNTQGIIAGTGGVFSRGQISDGGFRPNNAVSESGNARTFTMSFGNSQSHNNMPPYLSIYMWKRVS